MPAAGDAAAVEAQGRARSKDLAQARLPVLHADVAAQLLGGLAEDRLSGKSQGAREEGVRVQVAALVVEARDAVLRVVRKRTETLLAGPQRLLGSCALRDVEPVTAHDGLIGDEVERLLVPALAHDHGACAGILAGPLAQPLGRGLPIGEPWVRQTLHRQVGE